MQFVILAIGNTNAALPTNTNANNVELTAMEVPGLKQIAWNQLNGIKSIGKEMENEIYHLSFECGNCDFSLVRTKRK